MYAIGVATVIAAVYAIFSNKLRGPISYILVLPIAFAANSIGVATCSQLFMLDLKGRATLNQVIRSLRTNFTYHLVPVALSIIIFVLMTYCNVGNRKNMIMMLSFLVWILFLFIWSSVPSYDRKRTFARKFQVVYQRSEVAAPMIGFVASTVFVIAVLCQRFLPS